MSDQNPLTPPGPSAPVPPATSGPAFPDFPSVTEAEAAEQRRELITELVTSALVVLAWFAVAAVIGALIWVEVTPLPEFTRIATTGTMDEEQLAKQFSTNGWFTVIAAIGGLVSGLALLLLRRKSPVAMVGMVAVGGAVATLVMLQLGLAWGPGDPNVALGAAQIGDKVPVQLKPDAKAVYFAWSIAALLGAALALWLTESFANRRAELDQAPGSAPYAR
ncbi:hypothetical protein ABIE44_000311 [Marmoricola sp. OAE513]|uniref:hypothetical protein n=1 Tax=Marmoricola sp. OAE513 TaxID=2817894 RepID=UPI001AE32C2C